MRWGREILATAKAHLDINDLLTDAQRPVLQAEVAALEGLLTPLVTAVGAYRGFLDHAHVDIRAKQRVANHLCDEAQRQTDGQMRPYRETINASLPGGFSRIFSRMPLSRVLRVGHERTVQLAVSAASALRTLPPSVPGTAALADRLEGAAGKLRTALDQQAQQIDPLRAPLKAAVERAVFHLREGLEQMDARLRAHFSPAFIESLYPELDRRGTAVADEDDEDDDESAPPEAAGGDAG